MTTQSDLDRIVRFYDEVRVNKDSLTVHVSPRSITAKRVRADLGMTEKRYVPAVTLGVEQGVLVHHGSQFQINASLEAVTHESLFTVLAARERASALSKEAHQRHIAFCDELREEMKRRGNETTSA